MKNNTFRINIAVLKWNFTSFLIVLLPVKEVEKSLFLKLNIM